MLKFLVKQYLSRNQTEAKILAQKETE